MQQSDMRIGAFDEFAVHFQDQAQHAVRRRMLRAEIQRMRVDLHLLERRGVSRGGLDGGVGHVADPLWAFSSPGSEVIASQGDKKSKLRKSCTSFTGS